MDHSVCQRIEPRIWTPKQAQPQHLGRGVVPIVFWGNQLPGAGDRCPYRRTAPKAVNLMGDCCGSTPNDWKQGASNQQSHIRRGL